MPVHDWTRVDAGVFHHFHGSWITHIAETLNAGLLPPTCYALAEQKTHSIIPDVVTLQHHEESPARNGGGPGVALAVARPRVAFTMRTDDMTAYRALQRTLVIRHVSGDQVIAMIEIVSPANKDRLGSVRDFAAKAAAAVAGGIHLLILDLLPPGRHDPRGMHGAVWEELSSEAYAPPAGKPLTLAAYAAGRLPEAYVEPLAAGEPLIEMPLFLEPEYYVNVPLEATYQAAFRGVPAHLRQRLEAPVA